MSARSWPNLVRAGFLSVAVLAAPGAGAQTQQEYDRCAGNVSATTDQRISGCTAVIRSGKFQGKDLAWAYNNRGGRYNDKADYDRAIADYDQSLRLDPTDTDTFYNRGVSYKLKGELDRAIADYDRAIAGFVLGKYPINYQRDYFKSRGNAYGEKGNFSRAIADYDEAIKLDSGYSRGFYNRSLAKRKLGDVSGAESDLARARQLQPGIGVEVGEEE